LLQNLYTKLSPEAEHQLREVVPKATKQDLDILKAFFSKNQEDLEVRLGVGTFGKNLSEFLDALDSLLNPHISALVI
jgi:hypothetical protein